jgi:hypothetical protein
VAIRAAEFIGRGAIGSQTVGDDRLRMDALVLQQLPVSPVQWN